MSSSVVDIQVGAFAQSVAQNVALTGVLTTDLIVVVLSKYSASTVTVSGMGGTWTLFGHRQIAASNTRLYVYTTTGVSGSGNVTLTSGTTTFLNEYAVYVVRGLTNPSITAFADSTWYGVDGTLTGTQTTTAMNVDEGPAGISAGAEQVAIFAACQGAVALSGVTFPSNPTPTGWTVDRTPSSTGQGVHWSAHRVLTAPVTVQANIRYTTGTSVWGTTMLILGDAATTTELTSTFVGWGNPIF